MMREILVVSNEDNLKRLDVYISGEIESLSRSRAKNLIDSGFVFINGKVATKAGEAVKSGDTVEVLIEEPKTLNAEPQNIPLDVVYEDSYLAVINKPKGLVTHPAAGSPDNTLVNALLFRKQNTQKCSSLIKVDNVRPGIVHRLDIDTSGIIICAWDEETHAFLAGQFKNRSVKKNYIAIVCGNPKENKGRIETFIARDPKDRKKFSVSGKGRNAITYYKVIKQWLNYSLLLLRPKTGRTHQLRVHLKYLGIPVLGDTVYGYKDKLFAQATLMLHSKSLEITIPSDKEKHCFSSVLPQRFHDVIEKLDRINNG